MEATLADPSSESAAVCSPAPSTKAQPPAAALTLKTAGSRIALRLRAAYRLLLRFKSWLVARLEDLLEEFDPWLKWLIFDAVFTLLVGTLVKRFETLEPWAAAVGWL